MATLEKIRSKSVLLIVVIAVALLAFIIGDALTNSRNIFGDRTTIAKVGDTKIDYTDYQNKREELNSQIEMQKKQNPAFSIDMQLLPQIAINQLIGEKLLDNAATKLGISATGEQLRYYMLENPMSQNLPVLVNQMKAQGLDVQTPQQAYEIIFNPKRYGLTDAQVAPYKSAWLAMEEETKRLITRYTYRRLLLGTVRANDLDKKTLHDDYATTADVKFAYKAFGTLDPKKYPISDAELSAQYQKDKKLYEIDGETKTTSVIAVAVAPSASDIKESRDLASKVMQSLSDSLGTLTKEQKKAGVQSNRRTVRVSDLPAGSMKDFLISATPGKSTMIKNDISGFIAVKLGRRTTEVDSIQLNLVQVAGKTLPSKVLTALNSGLSIDSISGKFSNDSVIAQAAQWIPMFNSQGRTNAIDQAQLDSLNAAGGKYITLLQEDAGAVIAQISKQTSPVEVLEFDEFEYDLKPSTQTVTNARNKLEKFVADNTTVDKFNKNAQKAGYSVTKTDLSQSVPALPISDGAMSYYPDSRPVVRWVVMDAAAGDVSRVYESKDALKPMLYAVAVDEVFDEYLPISHRAVKEQLTDKIRRQKAGDALVKQYSGKGNTEQTAAAMGQPVMNGKQKIGQGSTAIADAEVGGYVMGMKPKARKVLKGKNGVYVVEITGVTKDKIPYNDDAYSQQYYQMLQLNSPEQWLDAALKGNNKVKNYQYKFEAGD